MKKVTITLIVMAMMSLRGFAQSPAKDNVQIAAVIEGSAKKLMKKFKQKHKHNLKQIQAEINAKNTK